MDVSSQLNGSAIFIRGERGLPVHYMVIQLDGWLLYGVIQEERYTFWKLIVSVIVRKGHMNKCVVLNRYQDTAV